jgi:tryptophanyl-tRNA synthetase
MSKKKPVIFSGIQPSGNLTVGNYGGAIKNWVELQDDYLCYYCLVDLHTITIRQDPAELRKRCFDFLALYLACGIDPERSVVFVQSHVPSHAELAWILGCYTYIGELGRMTQFKDKATRGEANACAGLFTYPVLMAADILLYQTNLVPVGEDQKQHVEITRDIAVRFNNLHGDTFTVPEHYIPPVGARLKSLQDPTKKMSKSDENPRTYIALLDPPEVVRSKVRRAVTDSGTEIAYDEEKRPGISNLMTLFHLTTELSLDEISNRYDGGGYQKFKENLAEATIEFLRPLQRRYSEIRKDKSGLESVLTKGAATALEMSHRTLEKVYRKIGFIKRPEAVGTIV